MANIAMHAMLATCWATATGPAASRLTHAVSLKRVNTIPLWASSGRRTCDFQTVSMYCTAEFSLRNTFPALYLHMQHRVRPSARCTFYGLRTPQSAQRDKRRFVFWVMTRYWFVRMYQRTMCQFRNTEFIDAALEISYFANSMLFVEPRVRK